MSPFAIGAVLLFGAALGFVLGVAYAVREHQREEAEAYRRAVRLSRQRQYGERGM